MAKLTFFGAAGSVTGSKYLVEAAGKKLLVDCGIFQGTSELKDRNYKSLSIDPKTFDYAMLTHAHLDHTGWLPVLVKDGYHGPIFANPATIELTTILLADSAHIQEEDALHAQKGGYTSHANPQALYTPPDVEPVLKLLKPMPRSGGFDLSPEFHVVGYDAGHILGSSSLQLTITENGKKIVVVFSGDIGRYDQPILNDPTTPSTTQLDVLLCESTYGDREHPDGDVAQLLADIVNRVVKRGGSIVIPSFAIGRTQTFMYYLRELEDAQKIPRVPVYVDSPMALSATDLYLKHHEDHDLDFTRAEDGGKGDPLDVHEFHLARTAEESKAINSVKTPCIIISASGMVSGGRVLHHLAQRLPDPKNAVILAGFQAEGTRGRALQEGAKSINLYGQNVPVAAEVIEMGQLSAHAGKSELLRWLTALEVPPQQTYLVHGEPAGAQALQAAITEKFKWPASVARYLDTVNLG
jgi:metallo-beta-lactamase family protein